MSDTVTPETLTVDDLTARLTALHNVAQELRSEHGWCSDWLLHFSRMSAAYVRNTNDGTFTVDVSRVTQLPAGLLPEHLTETGQAFYAEWVAAQVRAEIDRLGEHVRYYGSSEQISREEANRALAALGLPAVAESNHNRYMNLPYVRFHGVTRPSRAQNDALRAAIQEKFDAWLSTLNEIEGIDNADRYRGSDFIDFHAYRSTPDWGVTSEPRSRR